MLGVSGVTLQKVTPLTVTPLTVTPLTISPKIANFSLINGYARLRFQSDHIYNLRIDPYSGLRLSSHCTVIFYTDWPSRSCGGNTTDLE